MNQHGPASLWNAFDTLGQKGVQLNIRKVFLMFYTLSVYRPWSPPVYPFTIYRSPSLIPAIYLSLHEQYKSEQ